MNIFVLDPDPKIAASMHCDQHLHKMILESAQMLSTMFHELFPEETSIRSVIYKPAYKNHPCTQWVYSSVYNTHWLIRLCYELENIRASLGHREHSSTSVIKAIDCVIQSHDFITAKDFIFCGPAYLRINSKLSVPEKYKLFYQQKHRMWLDKGRRMSYINRPLPDFLSTYKHEIPHGN